MNTEVLNNVSDFFKPAAEAARALSRLNVATVEKVANVQLASVRANAELAIANVKAGIEVSDLEGVKGYVEGQNGVAKTVYDRLVADSKTLAGIAKEYGEEAGNILKGAVPAAAPAAPVAPAPAPKTKKAA